jgi:hypothetical protein
MTKPSVRFEWTVNLTHVLTIIGAVSIMAGGYFDLKSDVRLNKSTADGKFAEYDRAWINQKITDDAQESRTRELVKTLSDQIRELRQDIRADIRDLRTPSQRAAAIAVEPPSPERNLRNQIKREKEQGG